MGQDGRALDTVTCEKNMREACFIAEPKCVPHLDPGCGVTLITTATGHPGRDSLERYVSQRIRSIAVLVEMHRAVKCS